MSSYLVDDVAQLSTDDNTDKAADNPLEKNTSDDNNNTELTIGIFVAS